MNDPQPARLSEIPLRRPPWPHYPHCPSCHQRLASRDPELTRRTRGYPLLPCDGKTCPHCGTLLGAVMAHLTGVE